MHRLRHIIALLIVGVLGLQTGAMAMHTQLLPSPAADHAAAGEAHAEHGQHLDQHDQNGADSHHGPGCATAQSCFPVADVSETTLTVLSGTPVAPAGVASLPLPSPRPDPLLRPPRLPG